MRVFFISVDNLIDKIYGSCSIYGGNCMFEDTSIKRYTEAKEVQAKNDLLSFVEKNRGLIADSVRKKINTNEKVEEILIEANMKLGPYVFQRVSIKFKVMSMVKRIYFAIKKFFRKVEERNVLFSEVICDVLLVISMKVVFFK